MWGRLRREGFLGEVSFQLCLRKERRAGVRREQCRLRRYQSRGLFTPGAPITPPSGMGPPCPGTPSQGPGGCLWGPAQGHRDAPPSTPPDSPLNPDPQGVPTPTSWPGPGRGPPSVILAHASHPFWHQVLLTLLSLPSGLAPKAVSPLSLGLLPDLVPPPSSWPSPAPRPEEPFEKAGLAL